ncbi:MAG TPA: hypothetical protein VK530_05845 [Candidatus Acidoferrum sp.]|nr:hypothetical protein [Candidatus Acidoferrum sp.]
MKARRATFEDLPQLTALWTLERLNADALEKRFTEFQVVEDAGEVIAAIGLQISSHHGLLHSEAISRADAGEPLRQILWDRVQAVARNHSLDRIWTGLRAPFWRSAGFTGATEEQIAKMPETFGDRKFAWQLLLLRGAEGSADAIEKQFVMLRALQMQEKEKLHSQVSVMKKVAIGLTAAVALLVIAWAVIIFRYGPKFMNRQ